MFLFTEIDRNFYTTLLVAVIAIVAFVKTFRWSRLKKFVGQSSQWIITQNIIKSMQFVPESVITIDLEGVIISINEKTTKIFGWSKAELVGEDVSIILPKQSREEFNTAKLFAHLTGAANRETQLALDIEKKDGTLTPVEVSVGKWTAEEDHKQVFFTLIIRDVSHRKAGELANRQAHEAFYVTSYLLISGEKLLNSGSWRWDLVLDTVAYTEGFRAIFQLKKTGPITGGDLLESVWIEDRELADNSIKACQENGSAYDIEFRLSRLNGTKEYVRCSGEAEYSDNGKVLFINGAVQIIKPYENDA